MSSDDIQSDFNRGGLILNSFTKVISSILESYPDNGQILKELIQNAEDAGAANVKFLLDRQTYGCDSLLRPGLEEYQGPALLAYNDALFVKQDWESVRMMYDSNKKSDTLKVGRFGLGLKSVFHMTDVLSVASDNKIAFIDPHETYFNEVGKKGTKSSTYMINIDKNRQEIASCPDQWKPYKHSVLGTLKQGFETRQHYPGTLFRFPLRLSSEESEISSTVYTEEKVNNLFKCLKKEGYLYLIFLKHIKSIQIYYTNDKGEAELDFILSISSSCLKEVQQKRKQFVESLQSNQNCTVNYKLEIEEKSFSQNKMIDKKVHKFIVCQMYNEEDSQLKNLSKKLKVLPVVGLAYPLQDERIGSQVFCFLPLPIEEMNSTGLSLHVNGYLSVDNNRRHLKIATMDGNDDDEHVRWNTLLINNLIPSALKSVILNSTESGIQPEKVYDMIPNPASVKAIWRDFVKQIYLELPNMKIIAVTKTLSQINWEYLENVILKPIDWTDKLTSAVKKIFQADDKNFAEIPPDLMRGLKAHCCSVMKEATVNDVMTSMLNIRSSICFSDEERRLLLEFILNSNSCNSLIGLQLLPLINGEWIEFSSPSDEKVYFDQKPYKKSLLPANSNAKFLTNDLPSHLKKKLVNIGLKNETQLSLFEDSSILKELKSALKSPPPEYLGNEYFTNLWTYIYHNFSKSLDQLRGLYILPIGNDTVERIPESQESAIIHINGDISVEEKELLHALNIKIYENFPHYVLDHPQILKVFYSASREHKAEAILKQLKEIKCSYVESKINEMSSNGKKELRKIFCSLCPNISQEWKKSLSTLPIFQTLQGNFVQLAQCCRSGPEYDYVLPVPKFIINVDAEYTKDLLAVDSNIKRMEVVDILLLTLNYPVVDIQAETLERFMEACMPFVESNEALRIKMSAMKFVRNLSGNLVRAKEVLDPRDTNLQSLFHGEDIFPQGLFAQQHLLDKLLMLGMRRRDSLEEREVVLAARSVHATGDFNRAKILLKYFNENIPMFHKVLRNISEFSCFPVLQQKPPNYPENLEWRGCDHQTATFNDIRSFDTASVCGSSCYISPIKTETPFKKPTKNEVVEHLICCIKSYDFSEKPAFMVIITQIYHYFENDFTLAEVTQCLHSHGLEEWIWVGDKFASPKNCSFKGLFTNFEPYLFVIPSELSKLQNFLCNCGVRGEFFYVDILRRIRQHQKKNVDESRLSRDLHYTLTIINHIADTGGDSKDLILPIESEGLRFAPISKCCYWDSSAVNKGIGLEDLDDNLFLIHKNISPHVAEKLGVPSLLSVLMSDEDFGFDTGYGQSECLTTRLKNILRDYKDGLAIIKELIQNADDAGASTVKIVYDDRKFKSHKSSLFDESMKSLQGPAFLAYNDAVFSEEDLQNIIKLGGATKENITQKVGRFGLGFNSVYHLTEVPSFISGNSVVFFDPHKKYLGKAMRNKNQPGIKLDMTRRFFKKQREIFTDQFYPFNGLFDCDLSPNSSMENYPGTLFRFPLRTAIHAESSEISNKTYSEGEIKELFRLLYGNRETMLMFLQNVCRLEVYHLSEREETPELDLIFSIEKEIIEKIDSSIDNTEQFNILKSTKQIVEQKSDCPLNRLTYIQRIVSDTGLGFDFLELKDILNDRIMKQFLISCHAGLKESFKFARKSKKYLPIGGVALEVNEDHSLKECEAFEGQLFCFLPLPIKICLPFHINGYFAVSSSRTEICSDSSHDKNDEKSNWNKSVMIDPVLQAFIRCLEGLKEKHDLSITSEQWYSLWPVVQNDYLALKNQIPFFIDSFYLTVVQSLKLNIFKSEDKWVCYSDSIFLDPSFRESPIGNVSLKIFKQVISTKSPQKIVIDIPKSICQSLRITHENSFSDHFYDRNRFLQEIVMPNVEFIEEKDYSELIVYILFNLEDNDSIYKTLKNYSCIPSSSSQRVMLKPNQLIDPTSKLQCLYKNEDHRFPKWGENQIDLLLNYLGKRNCGSVVFSKLRDLGMEANTLPWKELIDRSKTVQKCIKEMGLKRSVLIVDLIAEKIQKKKPSKEIIPELFDIPFLPTLQSSPEMKLPRKYSNKPWCSINEGYLSECQNLVSCSFPIIDSFEMAHRSKHGWRSFAQYFGLNDKNKNISSEIVDHQLSTVVQEVNTTSVNSENISTFKTVIGEILFFYEDQIKLKKDMISRLNLKILPIFYCEEQNCFIELSKCSQKSDSIPPYLYKLSFQFKTNFQCLLTHLGIPNKFTDFDYISILNTIQEQSCDKTISSEDMQVCLSVIKRLHEYFRHHKRNIKELPPIYVPDSNNKMRLASDLCFNNTPWIKSEDKNFIHQDIPYTYAESLGTKDIRYKILDDCRFGLPFGQRDNLTGRLKRLLKGYRFDTTILKEILQNSDDCGASVLYFILDSRQHKTERIFSPKWSNLQGPALLVYNDKTFTQEDIEGIQNLGDGSKGKKPLKTGQFGVGFNCVYHLTDTPTFITDVPDLGECLFTFDPQCKYVHGADKNCPGQRYPTERVEKDFPDVFECYRSVQEMIGSRHGTLFRLPLRSKEMLKNNELVDHDEEVSPKVIRNLLKKMSSELNKCLLFMKSIVTIKLCEIDSKSDHLKDIMWSSSIIPDEDVDNRQRYSTHINETCEKLKFLSDIPTVQAEENICEKRIIYRNYDSPNSRELEEKWLVVDRFGANNREDMCKELLGVKEPLESLPRGGVAVLLSGPGRYQEKHDFFCLLPLPFKCNLPVHVNGSFSLEDETRRHFASDGIGQLWNSFLIKSVIAPAYLSLVLKLKDYEGGMKSLESFKDWYFGKFPTLRSESSQNDDWVHKQLVESFYHLLGESKSAYFPMITQGNGEPRISWHGLNSGDSQIYFDTLEDKFRSPENTTLLSGNPNRGKAVELSNLLQEFGMVLIKCPSNVRNSIRDFKIVINSVDPQSIVEHFSFQFDSMEGKHVSETPFRSVKTLTLFYDYVVGGINNMNKHHQHDLSGMCFILSSDEIICSLDSESPLILSKHSCLFPTRKDIFVHTNFRKYRIVESFVKDMDISDLSKYLSDILPIEEFTNRVLPLSDLCNKLGNSWLRNLWTFLSETLDIISKASDENYLYLEPINEWSLVPVIRNGEKLLIPMKQLPGVIDLSGSTLRKLSFYEPNFDAFRNPVVSGANDSGSVKTLTHLHGKLQSSKNVLYALSLLSDKFDGIVLNRKEAHELCLKFSSWSAKDIKSDQISLIKRIPMFIDICNNVGSLDLTSKTYTLPVNFPSTEMDVWSGCVPPIKFLFVNSQYENLYKSIQCHSIQIDDAYLDIILPKYNTFSPVSLLKHVEFLRDLFCNKDKWEKLPRSKELIRTLRNVKFIKSTVTHQLHSPSHFYNQNVEIFRLMVEPDRLLPKQFDYQWMNFLIELGMVNDLSNEDFLKFAQEIASHPNSKYSSELVNCLFNDTERESVYNDKSMYSMRKIQKKLPNKRGESFIQKIKSIPFVEPYKIDKKYTSIAPQYGQRDENVSYISFDKATLQSNSVLVWTQAKLLKNNFRYNKGAELLSQLGVQENPDPETVCNHLIFICDKLKDMNDTMWCLEQILIPIYDYLKLFKPKENIVDKLEHSDIIPIKRDGKNHLFFVQPSYVVVKNLLEEDEIFPYLCQLPNYLGPFDSLFISWGSHKRVTSNSYPYILRIIYEKSAGNLLEPNERDMVRKITVKFFELMKKSGKSYSGEKLHLPTEDGRLESSNKIVFIDNPALKKRVSSLNEPILCTQGIEEYNPIELFEKLPISLRPLLLSSVVKEQILNVGKVADMKQFVSKISSKFFSPEFHNGICRILSATSDSEIESRDIVATLKKIDLRPMAKLTTILSYKNQEIPGSKIEKVYHVDYQSKSTIIYLKSNVQIQDQTLVMDKLVDILSKLLKLDSEQARFMRIILEVSDSKIDDVLDERSVKEYKSKNSFQFSCGEYVPLELHALLVQGLDVPLNEGDYVAYQLHDPESEDDPAFIFVQIVEIIVNKEKKLLNQCRIDFGDGERIETLMIFLFQFDRLRRPNSTNVPNPLNSCTLLEKQNNSRNIRLNINKLLKEANTTLPDISKKQVYKRLALQWHPDLNHSDEQQCTQIFQYLQVESEKIDPNISNLSGNIHRRAKQLTKFSEVDNELLKNHKFSSRPNPQPAEAKRWIKQAKIDLEASQTDRYSYNEWFCFKCHKAAEKALKAVQFQKGIFFSNEHDLDTLCWDDDEVREWCSALESIGNASSFRYPTRVSAHNNVENDIGKTAYHYASLIVDRASTLVYKTQ